MTERLFVYLDESWPERPEAEWVLLDHGGAVLRRGSSAPSGWPGADRLEGIVGASQCLWLEFPLPLVSGKRRLKRADEAKLIANGLEEKIVDDPDSQHWVVTHRREDGGVILAGVLVMSKQRVRQLCEALSALGKPADALYSELQSCPWDDDECTLLRHGDDWIVRASANTALVLPEAVLPEALGKLASSDAGLRILTPPGDSDLPSGLLSRLNADGRRIRCDSHEWWNGASRVTNLLQGVFSQGDRQRTPFHSLRWPALAFGFLMAAQLVITLAAWSNDRLALNRIRGDMERMLAVAAPGMPVVLPTQQLHQILGTEAVRHGQLRDDDLLTLLAALSEVLGSGASGLVQVDYDNRQMEITLTSNVESSVGGILVERFAERGLQAEPKGGGRWRIAVRQIEE